MSTVPRLEIPEEWAEFTAQTLETQRAVVDRVRPSDGRKLHCPSCGSWVAVLVELMPGVTQVQPRGARRLVSSLGQARLYGDHAGDVRSVMTITCRCQATVIVDEVSGERVDATLPPL